MQKEIWLPVNGYEGLYEVSNMGRVRSKYCVLKLQKSNFGYNKIQLHKNKKVKHFFVHRLVTNAFIPNPKNKTQVNHIDSNKLTNHVSNLEWCTPQENTIHAVKSKTFCIGKRNKATKLKEKEVLKIRQLFSAGLSQTKIASLYNVTQPNISAIILRMTWKHI